MESNNSSGSGSGREFDRSNTFASVQTASTNLQNVIHGNNTQSSQSGGLTGQSPQTTTTTNEATNAAQSKDAHLQENMEEEDDSDGDMITDSDDEAADIDMEDAENMIHHDNSAGLSGKGNSAEHDENDPFSDLDLVDVDHPFDDFDLSLNTMYNILDDMANESETAIEMFEEEQQKDLDLIAQVSQAQFLRQPVSTQLILAREAADVFKEYGQHGSAARLSERIMQFLDGGDNVERKVEKVVSKPVKTGGPFGAGGPGYRRELRACKEVIRETSNIRFAMLPEEVLESERQQAVEAQIKRENMDWRPDIYKRLVRKLAVAKSQQDKIQRAVEKKLTYQRFKESLEAGCLLDLGQKKEQQWLAETKESAKYEVDINMRNIDDATPTRKPVSRSHYPYEQGNQSIPDDDHLNEMNPWAYIFPQVLRDANNTIITAANFIPPLESFAPYPAMLNHNSTSTMTTDPETHALLTDPSALPFNPLDQMLTLDPGVYFPTGTLESLNHILQIYTLASSDLYRHLTLSYTPSSPLPPPTNTPNTDTSINPHFHTFATPPLALFRLASSQYFSAQVSSILQPALSNDLFICPQSRALLRSVYDSLVPGRLNHVEAELLQRACRLGGMDAVDAFWEERNVQLKAWIALKGWRRKREVEKVGRARLEGRF